tara:strand:+ start:1707 stop:2015 length:309 start_codon:yes stop_codon:yes gene_type:complete
MTDKSNQRLYTTGLINQTQGQLSECRLWRAVISQSISDAYLPHKRQRLSITRWIETEDFIDVCDLANVDTRMMRKNIKYILSIHPTVGREEGKKIKELLTEK